jgi:hypothetical protein
MTFRSLMVHRIGIVTPAATVDAYGNTVDDWATATTVDTVGWVAQPGNDEDTADRDQQTRLWKLFAPDDTVITGHDRVTWQTLTFEVVGPPFRSWTPRGEHHIEADLKLVEG